LKLTGPKIVVELREKLQFPMGRHLYGVLGSYAQLKAFERHDLAQARDSKGNKLPPAVNVNHALLARIGDEDLRQLVADEGRRPLSVKRRLNQEFDQLLHQLLQERNLLVLKQLELLFAYGLDLSVLRTRASNQNHILLLLPGERRSEQLIIFHEADTRFHRTIPKNLIADNHLWELANG
jgi:hypothetical protein